MDLSIVTTLYHSASHLEEFYARACAAAERVANDFEIILVNDGSPDNSLEIAVSIYQKDHRVKIIDLSRNFGHHKAMMTGLAHAGGHLVFLIDSDLEEEPELLLRFYERFNEGGCEVVYGIQEKRRGGFIERVFGELFFSLVDLLSDEKAARNNVSARLMTRTFVRALVRHRDREFLLDQLSALTGFMQVALPVKKLSRATSTYTMRHRLELGVRYLTTSSPRLLYLVFYVGLFISLLSASLIVYFVSRYAIAGVGVSGWTSLIMSIWFFGGLTTLILGILGIYIANILSESRRRPYTIIRRLYRSTERGEDC